MKKNFLTFIILAIACTTHANGYFIKNHGQLTDQKGASRSDVLFYGSIGNLAFFITNHALIYEARKHETTESGYRVHTHRCELPLLNSNLKANIVEAKYNSIPELNHVLNGVAIKATTASSFTVSNIYPNVDWVWTFYNSTLKYDFVVKPGGRVNDINIKVDGVGFRVNENNDLIIDTDYTNIREGSIVTYQNKKTFDSYWRIRNKIFAFGVDNYDPEQTLIIDHLIHLWGTCFCGPHDDQATDTKVDADEFGYFVCQTMPSNNIVTNDAWQSSRDSRLAWFCEQV